MVRHLVLAILMLVSASGARASELTEEQSAAVSGAETQGRALYAAAAKTDTAAAGTDEIVKKARSRISDFCDFKYRAVVVGTSDSPIVYFLAQPARASDIILGRHYKVVGETVTPSTKSCFALPLPPNAVSPVVTHLLSDTPTEFHVFLSLDQNKPIFVGTRLGVWGVENGKIRLLQRREASASPPAIADKPVPVAAPDKLDAAIAPYVSQAKASYPQARSRFLAGLSGNERFFVVTRVPGPDGKWEQAFIRVESIADGRITGTISSKMLIVTSYHPGDRYEFAESDLIDWVIVRPDGSEEGNVVGKFLDGYKP